MANEEQEQEVETGAGPEKPRSRRSDAGLPRRKSLLLSRAASARFARVAKALPGGEEELAGLLEIWIDKLFAGKLYDRVEDDAHEVIHRPVGDLEGIAIAAFGAKLRTEAADA